MASIGHQGWRQVKTNLAAKIDGRVAPPLAELVERVTQLQGEIAELKDIVTLQVDVTNQTTELVGRLLATASNRLDALEDALGQLAPGAVAGPAGSNGGGEHQPRTETAGATSGSEDPPQP